MRNKVFFQGVLIVGLALFMANLGAIIELVHHPDVPYFDKEHVIVGGITGLVTAVLFGFIILYVRRLKKITKDLSDTNAMCTLEIMEHQQTTEALRQHERLLSESQRLGHVGSFLLDATGFLQWSEELYHVYGVSSDTFTPNTESLSNLILPEDRSAMQVWIAACMAGEKPDALDFRINFPDGTIHYIQGDGEAVFDDKNRFLYLAGSAQDITERKQVEKELLRLASFLMLNHSPVIELDPAGEASFLNPAAERLFPELRAMGQSHPLLLNVMEMITDLRQGNIQGGTITESTLGKTTFELHLSHVQDINHIRIYVVDITERKRVEEALQRYSVELENNNKALQEALDNVKQLSAMLPICGSCKKIRDDKGYWNEVESYLNEHTETVFSHGICPDCEKKSYEDLENFKKENAESFDNN